MPLAPLSPPHLVWLFVPVLQSEFPAHVVAPEHAVHDAICACYVVVRYAYAASEGGWVGLDGQTDEGTLGPGCLEGLLVGDLDLGA